MLIDLYLEIQIATSKDEWWRVFVEIATFRDFRVKNHPIDWAIDGIVGAFLQQIFQSCHGDMQLDLGLLETILGLNVIRFKSIKEANETITRWITFYNRERRHSALQYKTPSEAFLLAV